jgi:hypothetical protein
MRRKTSADFVKVTLISIAAVVVVAFIFFFSIKDVPFSFLPLIFYRLYWRKDILIISNDRDYLLRKMDHMLGSRSRQQIAMIMHLIRISYRFT